MAQQPMVGIGDPMPRITLPSGSGAVFDSLDPGLAGMARLYWLGEPPAPSEPMATALDGCETLLHVVLPAPPADPDAHASWMVDKAGELRRAFAASGSLAVLVDSAGRVADLVVDPTPPAVVAAAEALFRASAPVMVGAKAPVLLIERIIEPAFGRVLLDYWERHEKLVNTLGSETGNVANADVKRRQDVQLDDPGLFVALRDRIVRRVLPLMEQAFHARIGVIEAPMIGCYPASTGGWFRAHRDNTSRFNAHRQYALTMNLNGPEDYDGGTVRFPEFGRELYRPPKGGGVVFSCSLLHEVLPVTRGRRFGVFTFLSATGPSASAGPRPGR
ncbi:MAG: 2OG-Fe(II) oxygenase [Reyranellaceae bacterium]